MPGPRQYQNVKEPELNAAFAAPALTLQEPDERCCARFSPSIGAFRPVT
jgi:hypothetical protein